MPYDTISLLGMYLGLEILLYICTRRYVKECSLLVTAKTGNSNDHLSRGEWINKMFNIHTMKYHVAIKVNE